MAELTVPTAESLRERLAAARKFLDLEHKEVELQDLRAQAASPGLWDDPDTARQVTQKLANYEDLFERVNALEQAIEDAEVLAELAAEAGDEDSRAEAEAAYDLARGMGFHNINMDLIAGLPGEDAAMFARTLAWAGEIAPESLTVHTLSLKRSSDMYRCGESTPREPSAADMVRLAREAARGMGMRPYYLYRQKHMAGNLENVGYALPGRECLYNMDMMEDTGSVLALGAGGISKRVYENGARILRAPNVKDPEHYIARVDEMIKRKEELLAGSGRGVKRPGE